jgi:methionyl-tRNA formyltransferase
MKADFKVVLLSTDTTHHLYYAWRLSEAVQLEAIVLEGAAPAPPFDTTHPFEVRRDAHERESLLAGCKAGFVDLAETYRFDSLNEDDSLRLLGDISPEVLLVFGTRRLSEHATRTAGAACLNLHGGNPEKYRGLDSHLWAIYHRDFDSLMTTLHVVDSELDTGDIVLQAELPLTRSTQLHELRGVNTTLCVELSVLALWSLQSRGRLPRRKQLERGRYYSYMPAALKQTCLSNFAMYTADL